MKTKRAQTEIIVTVLIVLIALAAVAFVATFIMNMVKSGTTTATDKTDCLKVTLTLDKVTNATANNLLVSRQNDEVVIKSVNIYVNGKLNTTTTSIPNKMETTTYGVNVSVGSTVRINAVLNSTGTVCETGSEKVAIVA